MNINQVNILASDGVFATNFEQTELNEEQDNSESFTISTDQKPHHGNNILQFQDDQAYEKSGEVIHQGTNLTEFTLIVNQFETEHKQKFLHDATLDDVVNYFKKATGDDQLVPINFKIPRSQINNIMTKGQIPLKMLIHNQNIYIKCQSNNEQWVIKEEDTNV
ncbi:hypothetical protein pb186bvf_000647 [Paramecium bursaria]